MTQFHYPAESENRMAGASPYQQWVLDHSGEQRRNQVLDALCGKFGRGLSDAKVALLLAGFTAMLWSADGWERTAILGAQMGIWRNWDDAAAD